MAWRIVYCFWQVGCHIWRVRWPGCRIFEAPLHCPKRNAINKPVYETTFICTLWVTVPYCTHFTPSWKVFTVHPGRISTFSDLYRSQRSFPAELSITNSYYNSTTSSFPCHTPTVIQWLRWAKKVGGGRRKRNLGVRKNSGIVSTQNTLLYLNE